MKFDLINRNPLLRLTFEFSLGAIAYCEELEGKKKFVIARQLLRAATSIGANSMEAQNAESKRDFMHRLKIAAKEGEETQYWLWLCQHAPNYPDPSKLVVRLTEIQKVLSKILQTLAKST